MGVHRMKHNEMRLVLSMDAKPRLKWTPQLHHLFLHAVTQLGGADKATPKSLMRVMNIHGLTLYHLKSHLQKYRQGKGHQSRNYSSNNKERDCSESDERCNTMQKHKNESVQIVRALQVQMEAQKKIHEQIEVQKHLQLRIEAQGKYLQSALKKAQEILLKAEVSPPIMVDMRCPSTTTLSSGLTETELSIMSKDKEGSKQDRTSTGQSARKRRMSFDDDDDHICVEKPSDHRFKTNNGYDERLKSSGFLENLDLKGENLNNYDDDDDAECKAIDLNREWR